MSTHIRDIISAEAAHVSIDSRLAKALEDFYIHFTNKSGEHAEFFGGHLTGAHRVSFMPSNENAWWDIVDIDKRAVYDRFEEAMRSYQLRHPPQEPPVNLDWHISTDPMNQVSVWLMWAFYNEKKLKEEFRLKGMIHAYLIMQVRFLTSKIRVHWHNPCTKDIAEAVYTAMSRQYLIKRRENWRNLLYIRALSSVTEYEGEKPNFNDVVTKMDDDVRVVKFLNDAKSFISGQIENIYGFHKEIMKAGAYNVMTLGAIVEKGEDGGTKMRDRVSAIESYTNYILGVVGDEHTFIKDSLCTIILKEVRRCRPALLESVLKYISVNWITPKVTDALKQLLLHGYEYMSTTKGGIDRTLTIKEIIQRLKGVYSAPKASDDVIELRDAFETFVKESTGIQNPADKAAIRTAVMLYIMARTLIRDAMT